MGEGEVKSQSQPEIKRLFRVYDQVLHWRPRNGEAAEGYWALRYWCEQNDINIGEFFNSIVPVIAYYATNFTTVDGLDEYGKPKVHVNLTAGTIPIKRTKGKTGRRPTHKLVEEFTSAAKLEELGELE
jgi:hypothetical protein